MTKAKLIIIINQPMFNTRRIRIKNTVTNPRTDSPSYSMSNHVRLSPNNSIEFRITMTRRR